MRPAYHPDPRSRFVVEAARRCAGADRALARWGVSATARYGVERFVLWWVETLRGLAGVAERPVVDVPAVAVGELPAMADAEPCVVVLPADHGLIRTLTLPLEARQNLDSVVRLELERCTPFRAEDVELGHAITSVDYRARRIEVELTVVPKRRLEDPAALARASAANVCGWRLEGSEVTMTAADAPAASATRRAGRAGWRLPVLGLLLVSAVAVPTWRMEAAAEASRERAAGFREDAEAARAAREEVDRLDALGSNGGGSGSLLPLLAEATRRLPDDTWVTRFAYRPGELELAGYSASAASVPRLLAESGLVTGAELTAPVSFDARTGGERFVVRARGGDR